jgi:hypothetical protein
MRNKCRAKQYIDNEVIFRGSIVCWGFKDKYHNDPHCKFLEECLQDYIKIIPVRKINSLNKKYGFYLTKDIAGKAISDYLDNEIIKTNEKTHIKEKE